MPKDKTPEGNDVPVIELRNIDKTFRSGKTAVSAVRNVSLSVSDGEIFGIIGFSGAGKSTLVRCINLLERPTSGQVVVDGVDLTTLSAKQLRAARKNIGMIFQQFNLLSQRTVANNVRFPLETSGVPRARADERVRELLQLVDLSDKADVYPAQLSGGQKQRVAIARALACNPKIILCDEATSALDPLTTHSILDLLKRLNEQLGVTIVVITHEMRVVEQICDRVAVMDAGEVVEEGRVRDVFLRPQSETARRLIDPAYQTGSRVSLPPNTLRLAFTGEESGAPVISDLTVQCNAMVSIVSANTENIGGKPFGQMLIEMPPDAASQARICAYLDKRGISYEKSDASEGGGRMPKQAASAPSAQAPASDASNACDTSQNDVPAIGKE
ncbi:ATP-binding cassette domain-containing protein [Eggerthellaceae bacterium zg-886]|uniref:ATP-binding cassette domain-containing protein n=1 Tax=Xiamenia xianingshaonis TaxID=2682776 RepID=A0A9E6SU51_9ACTN|nr:ATP-binding cassette domain-containing protein [Xiamenia xianingshaonis]QTU84069.1 methionine ABC transporter ATP-binding protein [Xiamenia xianingshaonis]